MEDVLYTLLTAAAGYVAWLVRKWVLANTTPKQLAAVAALAQQAVESAEQLGGAAEGAISNADKLDLASEALVVAARRLGIRLKEDEVTAFIHAAVREMRARDTERTAYLPG